MQILVLGPIAVLADGHPLALGGQKQRTVLAMLAANSGVGISTDGLIQAVWGDDAPSGARRSLSTYLSNLRSEIGDVIQKKGTGYVLEVDRDTVDAHVFEDMVAAADDLSPQDTARTLREALALWRGYPYADVDGYMTLSREAARLNELRMVAIEKKMNAELEAGHHRDVIGELDALTSEYPLRERFRAQQMIALFRSGRQAEALRAYQMTRHYLGSELGIDPSEELRDLEQRILEQDTTLRFRGESSIVQRAVLVADVENPQALAALSPSDRDRVIGESGNAIDDAVDASHGAVFSFRGAATYAAFESVGDALDTAQSIQIRLGINLLDDDPQLSIALDFGDVETIVTGELAGPPVARSASLAAVAHGGQVLLSSTAHAELSRSREPGRQIKSLGEHALAGVGEPLVVYQLVIEGLDNDFRPLNTDLRPSSLAFGAPGIPGYEIREQVGAGPLGVVHKGYQPSVGRQVAIKVFRPKYVNQADFIRRFEIDAQLVARLGHPHIVPLYDYWRDPEGAYLVTRWMAGGSLDRQLDTGGPMALDDVAAMVAQLAPAIDAAHRMGAIHRDIKPSNVMIDAEGNLYLSDFGIASEVFALSNAGQEPGTTANLVDERTDVAGFGHLLRASLGWPADHITRDAIGDHNDLLQPIEDVLDTACADDPDDRYDSIMSFTEAWEDAVREVAAGSAEPVQFTPTRNPYRGLSAFQEPDAEDFFGRETEITALLDALASNRLVAVVGPSGIGKSSLVRAGLLPALRSGALPRSSDWLITDMVPGAYAFEEIASALLRIATERPQDLDESLRSDRRGLLRATRRLLPPHSESLIVIDQFEEVFTLGADPGMADLFLEALTTLVTDPGTSTRVVLTLRADFFDLPLRHAEFGELLKSSVVPVAAPGRPEIRNIIMRPAAALNVTFEPGLVEHIASSVAGHGSVLPLLEFALTELFEQRASDTLTWVQHEAGGGVLGSIGQQAEQVYQRLDSEGRAAARQVFLRLVAISETNEPTGRRTKLSELNRIGTSGASVAEVLDRFGEVRLIVFDRDQITRGSVVEVAHEAIFTQWERLERWIEEQRADLVVARNLNSAATEWENSGRDSTYLATGGRLAQFAQWNENTNLAISRAGSEYITASLSAERDRTARRRRTRRRVTAGFAIAAVAASVLAVAALIARSDATTQAATAEQQTLVLQSILQAERDPELGMLLAIEALDAADAAGTELPEGVVALRNATEMHRLVARYDGGRFVAVSPDGLLMATAADAGVAIREIETGAVVKQLDQPNATAIQAAFNPDGQQVAVAYEEVDPSMSDWDSMLLWTISDGTAVPLGATIVTEGLETPLVIDDVEISPDGERVAAAAVGVGTVVWSATSGEHVYTIPADGSVAFHPVRDVLAVSDSDGSLGLYDSETGLLLKPIDTGASGWLSQVFSPDGSKLAVSSQQDGRVMVFDVDSGEQVMTTTVDRPGRIAWFSDAERLIVGADSGVVRVLDAETGTVVTELLGHHSVAWTVATVNGSDLGVSAGLDDGATIVWSTADGPRTYLAAVQTDIASFRTSEYLDGGALMLVSSTSGPGGAEVKIVDSSTGSTIRSFENQRVEGNPGAEASAAGHGAYIITAANDYTSSVRRATTGDIVYSAPDGWAARAVSDDGSMVLIAQNLVDEHPEELPARVVDPLSGSTLVTMPDVPLVRWAEFSTDGSRAIMRTYIWEDVIVDIPSGQELTRLRDVGWAELSPDGTLLAIAESDGTLRLLDVGDLSGVIEPESEALDAATRWTVDAHGSFVPIIRFNADSSLILTATFDEPVRVWDVETGEQLGEFPMTFTTGSPRAEFHPTENHIRIQGDGGVTYVYSLDDADLIATAAERLTRDLTSRECRAFLDDEVCDTR
ncbi:MAG: BTAD domain-containing putative transcriptional regulator [Actinomycetota bacterium]